MIWYDSIPNCFQVKWRHHVTSQQKDMEKRLIFSRFSTVIPTVIPWQVWLLWLLARLLAPLWCFTVPWAPPRGTSALPRSARGRQLEAEDFVELLERPEGAQDLQEKPRAGTWGTAGAQHGWYLKLKKMNETING